MLDGLLDARLSVHNAAASKPTDGVRRHKHLVALVPVMASFHNAAWSPLSRRRQIFLASTDAIFGFSPKTLVEGWGRQRCLRGSPGLQLTSYSVN